MIVLIGKTCSGKTSIANEMMKLGFHRIVTTTTRDIREGETQDVDYHFVAQDKFKEMIHDNEFVEWKSYITSNGVWYYGTSMDDIKSADEKSILIITPDGLKDLLDKEYNIVSVYIYANNNTIRGRLLSRGDDKNEAERRLKDDNEKFKHVEDMVDKIIYNNANDKLEEVVSKIVEFVKGR